MKILIKTKKDKIRKFRIKGDVAEVLAMVGAIILHIEKTQGISRMKILSLMTDAMNDA
ncbi:MAG TPA: hypothetical protein IAA48_05960 [Candidatus Eubacterium faecipullorum]|uniref:Uncharacterized protein n=1 Tax=Candidatus Eubacterium faecipullorum TaxID=2838571 RepID=A0A9D1UGY8_9FIRM|nr:hypothetical protein [Candidatus Eubacterium faecipullorum]